MERLSNRSSKETTLERLSAMFKLRSTSNGSRHSSTSSNGIIVNELTEFSINPTFQPDVVPTPESNDMKQANAEMSTQQPASKAIVEPKNFDYDQVLKNNEQETATKTCSGRSWKVLLAVGLIFIVIIAVTVGVVVATTNTSPVHVILKDTQDQLQTSLLQLRNTGGTDLDIKKSSGDHVETTIHLVNGDVDFIFDKGSGQSALVGTLVIIAQNVTIIQEDLDRINSQLAELEARSWNNPRARFAITILSYLARASVGQQIDSRVIPLNMKQSTEVVEDRRQLRELAQCADTFLSTWATPPYAGVSCPTYTTKSVGDSGATCLCPYQGTTPREARYDAIRPSDGANVKVSWFVKYGSATSDCLGRCGAGCNSGDKEAFQDCLDHDVCLNHVGGSLMAGNPSCGNEFNQAADDYVVSYGWSCC